jgi:hypothetical protein
MTEEHITLGSAKTAEYNNSPGDEWLLGEKLRTSLGIYIDVYGVANVAASAELLYDSVFAPDTVVNDRAIPESIKFPNRNVILSQRLTNLAVHPDTLSSAEQKQFRATFVDDIRHAVTSGIDNEVCLYPGAQDAVRTMAQHGPLAFWTHGDMYGQPARQIFGRQQPASPGSYEQLKKLAGSGVNDIRHEIAAAALAGSTPEKGEFHNRLKQTMMVDASEDKFAPQVIDAIASYFKKQEISEVVVVEDRLHNIQDILPLLEQRGLYASGIWVRQGEHSQPNQQYDSQNIREAATVTEAAAIIADGPGASGTICDFDGVLSDQKKRLDLQAAAVQQLFYAKQWLV